MTIQTDVLIIGAGAAGLMCAITAGERKRRVIIVEHTDKVGEKIRISGGGRCNFTNLYCTPDHYISGNPHFCRSALKRYNQHDFINFIKNQNIHYHEKTLGQLFCDHSAVEIINAFKNICQRVQVDIKVSTSLINLHQDRNGHFIAQTTMGTISATSVVVASGGLSIPKIGATALGYDIARQFGLNVLPTRAGLVPLTFDPLILEQTGNLSGLAVDPVIITSLNGKSFKEALLFTHRGISGPAVLQISSYWQPGEPISINLCPETDLFSWLKRQRQQQPKSMLQRVLSEILPKRLVQQIITEYDVDCRIADLSDKFLQSLTSRLEKWTLKPSGSEGYRTAEVTLGGVDTDEISSKTFESKKIPGLYFIGEVLDVTGHLGGYNFQWAWSSGWCAGNYV